MDSKGEGSWYKRYKDIVLALAAFLILLILVFLSGTIDNIVLFGLILFFSLLVIIKSADVFLEGATSLAKILGLSEFLIGLTLVSIGTSVPEIASTGMASFEGHANLAIGNIYGSVLVQITFIMGIVVLFCPVKIEKAVIMRDGLCMLGAVAILTIFVWPDKKLILWEAVVLISLYVIYIAYLVFYYVIWKKETPDGPGEISNGEGSKRGTILKSLFLLGFGLPLVVFGAANMVDSSAQIALHFNVDESVIGTAITSFGTSVPELIVAAVAIKKAKGLALGTLIGSNITDPLLSIGIAGVINPIEVSEVLTVFHYLIPMTIVACVLVLWFMRTNFKLTRFEGSTLVILYLITIVGLFLGWDIINFVRGTLGI